MNTSILTTGVAALDEPRPVRIRVSRIRREGALTEVHLGEFPTWMKSLELPL